MPSIMQLQYTMNLWVWKIYPSKQCRYLLNVAIVKISDVSGVLGERYALLRERDPEDGRRPGVRYAAPQRNGGSDGECAGAPPVEPAQAGTDVPVG